MAVDPYETFKDYGDVYLAPDEHEPFPRYIQALFRRHVTGRYLDIGCADGCKLRHIVTRAVGVSDVLAIEPSGPLCTEARERVKDLEHVRVEHATLEDLEKTGAETGSFDTVTLLEVLEHIEDQSAVLTKIFSYLRPGGVFICSTPNRPVYATHCRVTGERRDPTHVSELNWAEFKALMGRFSTNVSYTGFWPVMFLYRRWPGLDFLNSLPGARLCSRTMYAVARKDGSAAP
jgi:SAM-dependent methyltransferase